MYLLHPAKYTPLACMFLSSWSPSHWGSYLWIFLSLLLLLFILWIFLVLLWIVLGLVSLCIFVCSYWGLKPVPATCYAHALALSYSPSLSLLLETYLHYHSVSEITLPWNVWVPEQNSRIKHWLLAAPFWKKTPTNWLVILHLEISWQQ